MERQERPKVLVITVNFNNTPDTVACVESVFSTGYSPLKVFLADSASEDRSRDDLARRFSADDRIVPVFLPRNRGFSAAVNEGLKYCLDNGYDYALLLNNDTVVHPRVVDELLKTAARDASVGIIGGKILFHGSRRLYSAGGIISYARNIGHLSRYGRDDSDDLRGETGSTFVSACLMLIRGAVLRDTGLFDEEYFMYIEDADFCFRARRKGWGIRTNLDAVIWHKEGGSSTPVFAAYWASRNRLRFIDKNLRGPEKAKALAIHLLSKPLLYLKLRDPGIIRADAKGAADYMRLRFSLGRVAGGLDT